MEYVKLYNGLTMPIFGIGTYLLTPDEAENSVTAALECGYRLIDTANMYGQGDRSFQFHSAGNVPNDEHLLNKACRASDRITPLLQRTGAEKIPESSGYTDSGVVSARPR